MRGVWCCLLIFVYPSWHCIGGGLGWKATKSLAFFPFFRSPLSLYQLFSQFSAEQQASVICTSNHDMIQQARAGSYGQPPSTAFHTPHSKRIKTNKYRSRGYRWSACACASPYLPIHLAGVLFLCVLPFLSTLAYGSVCMVVWHAARLSSISVLFLRLACMISG
jgi:hypothetical protein